MLSAPGPRQPARDVRTVGADRLRHEPERHQHGEHPAVEAQSEHGLERAMSSVALVLGLVLGLGTAADVGRAGPNRGAIRFWALQPSGLSVGPVRTRAQNPYASGIVSQYQPVIRVTALSTTTPAATVRAAFSLTGLGKPSSARTGRTQYRQLIWLGSRQRSYRFLSDLIDAVALLAADEP